MDAATLVDEYLLLGLRFDRLEPGFVDAYTGAPALRWRAENDPRPDPAALARRAAELRAELPGAGLAAERERFLDVHLRALETSGRTFAGEPVGFVDEVESYFDVRIAKGSEDDYRAAHRALDAQLPGAGPLAARLGAARTLEEIPADRLTECVHAFSSALRDRVRTVFPLPEDETVTYEVVTDKPWSGFNYYEGGHHSRVAINADLKQRMGVLPHLVAHESYPGHHTEHCRKDAGIVAAGQREQTLFVVNTPQCLMAEGLADLGLVAVVGPGWGPWAAEIYADAGLRFDGERAEAREAAGELLAGVRQDAAIMLHDEGADEDTVVAYLQRWLLVPAPRARQMLRFLAHPLWRAYTSTYVEGYRLLHRWLEQAPDAEDATRRYGRLLDEPLVPSAIRAELAG